jgi:hypothetical protein
MMTNPYDLHSWSTLYGEERLAERRTQHLVDQASADRDEPGGPRRFGLARRRVLAPLLRGIGLTRQ